MKLAGSIPVPRSNENQTADSPRRYNITWLKEIGL